MTDTPGELRDGRHLLWWAERITQWDAQGRDVLAYFNNDGDGNAVRNARALRALLATP